MDKKKIKWLDENCHACGKQLNSWDASCSKALAYKNKICERCIAKEYGESVEDLRATLESFYAIRPCMGL